MRVEIAPRASSVRVARRAIGGVVAPRPARPSAGRARRTPGRDRRLTCFLRPRERPPHAPDPDGAIVAALVGVVLLAVPGSPIHRKPTLGLDLQGGLEVVLQAVPPKGHSARRRPRWTARSVDHAEPHRQARRLRAGDPQAGHEPDRDRARRRPRPGDRRPAIIGKTAQLELYDFEADLVPARRSTRTATRSRRRRSTTCSTRVQKQAAKGRRRRTTSSATESTVKTTTKVTVKGKNGKKTTILKPSRRRRQAHAPAGAGADAEARC